VYLICLLHGLLSPIGATGSVDQSIPASLFLQNIPNRPRDAIRGQQFGIETKGMTGKERQTRALDELLRGNVPDFLRKLKPVRLSYISPHGEKITALIWVTPDYLAIGSDEDFLRIPLSYPSAVAAAQAFDCILPTRKMVDAIYDQATCHLKPDPLPPGPKMRSSEYYLKHRGMIRNQRKEVGCALGELVSGHKKDVVLTNRLNEKSGRIAIYGWHRKTGKPIQPLSTVHGERYTDYSHGVRLICKTVWINGQSRSILEVLQDPRLAGVLTYEGFISKLPLMLHLK
jgi:hypothetical protein